MAGQPQYDPFASNNALYPDPVYWNKTFRASNFDYPLEPVASRKWQAGGPAGGPLTKQNARAYVDAVKSFIAKDFSGLVNDPMKWTPQQAGWYDMPWGGQGMPMADGHIDPTSGREALTGSYTGQVIQPKSYPSAPPNQAFQNHAVVYYNDVAGYQLGRIWKDPFHPDPSIAQFPEGSIVVKVEVVTLTEDQWWVREGSSNWQVLKGSSTSYVYRPTVASLHESDPTKRTAVVIPTRFLQMAVRVKDTVASPVTGWVFIAFAYDSRSAGTSVWDRTVPVGATWGNDPARAGFQDGLGPNGKLDETWISDNQPGFIKDGLGWGGRLAGPLDLGIRHDVVTVSGKRYGDGDPKNPRSLAASSCVSCHSAAQYPFTVNLYPSPNMVFPDEGKQFLVFEPGSSQWQQWFQNRPGDVAFSSKGRRGFVGTDYDMMLTFALMRANGSADTDAFIRHLMAGH
jgi:hypothetical protein